MTYLITFSCYGCHLHGHAEGSVDWYHRLAGTPRIAPSTARRSMVAAQMPAGPFVLGEAARTTVLAAIGEVCRYRNWQLIAAHVRSTHVHVVVAGGDLPERMMKDFKAYSSRALKKAGLSRDQYWTRHGSTRWLNRPADVAAAIQYVVAEQGEPMAVYREPQP